MTHFSHTELETLLELAKSAAQNAAKIISEYQHTALTVRRKGEGSLAATVVTEVDVRSQTAIVDTLAPSLEAFDMALLSEEKPDDGARLQKRAFWCIDPLDGTLSFIEKTPGYSVSIGLVSKEGDPLLGVIRDPKSDRFYWAVKEQGAFCNGLAMTRRTSERTDTFTVLVDRSSVDSDQFSFMTQIGNQVASEIGARSVDMFNYGGAAMNAMVALTRAPACYFKFPRVGESGGSLWDYAASACIYREAGAIATDIFGQPLQLNRPDSTYMNHRGFIYATDARISAAVQRLFQYI